jgi:hypothetical protein
MVQALSVAIARCPLCGGAGWSEDSIPEPNLYSEKLAQLTGSDEAQLLRDHANGRCHACGLEFKRRWFADSTLRELFKDVVATHPKGWDAVLNRFSPDGFLGVLARWSEAVKTSATPEIRRGERELMSIIDSITTPKGFDPAEVKAAVSRGDVAVVNDSAERVAASIADPAPFRRFAGFRSRALWEYVQSRTGGFETYAEVGCPLWGLLPIAAESIAASYLSRDEANYWGAGCRVSGESCVSRLLADPRISNDSWTTPQRYAVIGAFQYLDHLTDPRGFLAELFAKADSAAIILDGVDSPVAIQHVTGWTDASLNYAAELFGKELHTDFDDIRPSGNRLYLFTERY